MKKFIDSCLDHPRILAGVLLLVLVSISFLAAFPSLFPDVVPILKPIAVDTDPENMLSADEPVRVFHNHMKKRMRLWDMVVVGIVNEEDPEGVYNPSSLAKVHELTEFAKTLQGKKIGAEADEGVIEVDIIAPSAVDVMSPGAPGEIKFSWLMQQPPKSQAAATKILHDAQRIPFLRGTLVPPQNAGNEAVALYLPITRKDLSHPIYVKLNEKVAELGGPEKYYITGLPVAEDVFGVQMFKQMAMSAPLAMLVIFVLLLLFFRKLSLIISPMIVAFASVVFTMGALIIAGFPIHIMSSMIPIFIMPIAVLDSIHIISEFFEQYQVTRDRRKTILKVMDELFMPMLYTSLTSAAGFASLALTPIPPVQIFGIFVALGVMMAWFLTISFIPAYVMLIPAARLENFGAVHHEDVAENKSSFINRMLLQISRSTYVHSKLILTVTGIVLIIAAWGISQININDNPIKWFEPEHPIRVADRVMNEHLGGTYMAYLALMAEEQQYDSDLLLQNFKQAITERLQEISDNDIRAQVVQELQEMADQAAKQSSSPEQFYNLLNEQINDKRYGETPGSPISLQNKEEVNANGPTLPAGLLGDDGDASPSLPSGLGGDAGGPALPQGLGENDDSTDDVAEKRMSPELKSAWSLTAYLVDEQQQQREIFKRPEVLSYIVKLQNELERITDENGEAIIGKSNSIADIVKTVHRDLLSGEEKDFRIPENKRMVAETLIQFQNSHRPYDLWHFVTPDYRTASIWVQLRSGDNVDMSRVAKRVAQYMEKNPPPEGLGAQPHWFGLTYINVVWQENMVKGMLEAFAGSFLVVLLLMIILFRSALWGLLSMIPLTVTIAAIYGAIGIVGKDYDMPTAVLSSLTLGLAVDFAIHFLARSRSMYAAGGGWEATLPRVFSEPARAIIRNIVVIAAGFLPLLLAPLVPYKTVGVLLAIILLLSGAATLLILPALIRILEKHLFRAKPPVGRACNCVTCAVAAIVVIILVVLNVRPHLEMHWTILSGIAAGAIFFITMGCGFLSRRQASAKASIVNKNSGRAASGS